MAEPTMTYEQAKRTLIGARSQRRNEDLAIENIGKVIDQLDAREQAVSHLESSRTQVEESIATQRQALQSLSQDIAQQQTLLEGKERQNDELRGTIEDASDRLQGIERNVQQRQVDFETQLISERRRMTEAVTAHQQVLENEREAQERQLLVIRITHQQNVEALERRASQAEALFREYSEKFDALEQV